MHHLFYLVGADSVCTALLASICCFLGKNTKGEIFELIPPFFLSTSLQLFFVILLYTRSLINFFYRLKALPRSFISTMSTTTSI
jgi:hypothetical protein